MARKRIQPAFEPRYQISEGSRGNYYVIVEILHDRQRTIARIPWGIGVETAEIMVDALNDAHMVDMLSAE